MKETETADVVRQSAHPPTLHGATKGATVPACLIRVRVGRRNKKNRGVQHVRCVYALSVLCRTFHAAKKAHRYMHWNRANQRIV